jgi:hypothetical protein
MILDLEETFIVGEDTFFDSISRSSSYGVVFEDDLTTGYFYAIEKSKKIKILDALHIYNVADVTDKENPGKIQIFWTDDGQFALLLINNYYHAIFDFINKAGYCRNGFPESNGKWVKVKVRNLTYELICSMK